MSVYQDKAGTDESIRVARDWIAKNAGKTGAAAPTISYENAFEMGKQHFNFLAKASRSAAFPRACDLACHVTGAFIDRSRHVSGRLLWTASRH